MQHYTSVMIHILFTTARNYRSHFINGGQIVSMTIILCLQYNDNLHKVGRFHIRLDHVTKALHSVTDHHFVYSACISSK